MPVPWQPIAATAEQLGAQHAQQKARVRDAEARAAVTAKMDTIRRQALLDALRDAPAPMMQSPVPPMRY